MRLALPMANEQCETACGSLRASACWGACVLMTLGGAREHGRATKIYRDVKDKVGRTENPTAHAGPIDHGSAARRTAEHATTRATKEPSVCRDPCAVGVS